MEELVGGGGAGWGALGSCGLGMQLWGSALGRGWVDWVVWGSTLFCRDVAGFRGFGFGLGKKMCEEV